MSSPVSSLPTLPSDAVSSQVLILDTDRTRRTLLAEQLLTQGLRPDCSDSESQALVKAQRGDIQLLCAAVSGVPVWLRELRYHSSVLILLQGLSREEDRITALRHGADDCVSPDIGFDELLSRMVALLRRADHQATVWASTQQLRLDALSLCRETGSVAYGSQAVALTPLQFRLLWTLAQSPRQILSKSHLYREVWGRNYSIHDRSLDMHLSRIRRKLQTAGMPNDYLTTVHGQGYRLG